MKANYLLNSVEDLKPLVQDLHQLIKSKKNTILFLNGEMAAGKTTFTRYLAEELGIKENITSPTFVGLHHYKDQKFNFLHYDVYQVELDLEFLAEILDSDESCCVVIEWASKLAPNYKKVLANNCFTAELDFQIMDKCRQISYNTYSYAAN